MTLVDLIQTMGLPGLALGSAIEGEAFAFMGGVLAHRHFFPLEAAVAASMTGALALDHTAFFMGHSLRRLAFVERVLNSPRMTLLTARLNRAPVQTIFFVRFVYGIKGPGAAVIGASHMPWRRFAMINFLAVALWAHLVAGLGFLAGHLIVRLFGELHLHWHLLVALVPVIVALVGIGRRWGPGLKQGRKPGGKGNPSGAASKEVEDD
jgi:membrane protein DedA with SNARE-associated domain